MKLNNVHFLGNKSNPYPYIVQADAMVLSSKYEGLPTVVYESLILHVPVVTMEVAGVREQLNEKTGIICENNVEALANAIEEMIKNNQHYKKGVADYVYENDLIIKEVEELLG